MTRTLTAALFASTLMTTGCFHKVDVSVMKPADIDLPNDVGTIVVVNRSLPAHRGEVALDVTEGWVTGETPRTDAYASEVAIDALVDTLQESGRYQVIELRADGKLIDTSLWDDPLDRGQIRHICRKAQCDAIIALDSFDSDAFADLIVDVDRPLKVQAHHETAVATSWRTWNANGQPIDAMRDTQRVGEDLDIDGLAPDMSDIDRIDHLIADLAWAAGRTYGERVAPHNTLERRAIYGGGSPMMREARKLARAGDWQGAAMLWKEVRDAQVPGLSPRARFNLAVYHEVHGNLDGALAKARWANRQLKTHKTAHYVGVLAKRIEDDARLADQLSTR